MTDELAVADNPADHRFEGHLDGRLVAFSAYTMRDGAIVFLHTEVDPEFEGRGLGSVLAKRALDDVRARGLGVIARCPFISAYIRRHREYADLLVRTPLGRSGSPPST